MPVWTDKRGNSWIVQENTYNILRSGVATLNKEGKLRYTVKSGYQLSSRTLNQLYGKRGTGTGYDGAFTKDGRLRDFLRPLGIGSKVTRRAGGKENPHIETVRQNNVSRRIYGKITWNKDGTIKKWTSERETTWGKKIKEHFPNTTGKKWASTTTGYGEIDLLRWPRHLQIAAHAIEINSVYFVKVMTLRSKQIFLKSFQLQKFNSADTKESWKPLSEYTKKVRKWRKKTSTKILIEDGKLRDSLDINWGFSGRIFTGTITTKNVIDRNGGRSVCYANIHNAESGTFRYGGKMGGGKPTVQRQFMGHSTYIQDYALQIMDRYFLSDVFTLYAGDKVRGGLLRGGINKKWKTFF